MKALKLFLGVISLCFSMTSFSGNHSSNKVDLSTHHFTLGTSWTNFATNSFWLNVGGITENFVWRLAGASTLFKNQTAGGAAVNNFEAICGTLHLGARKSLANDLGFEMGFAGGLLDFSRRPGVITQYSVGAYVGLDYLLSDHLVMHASVQPYAYRKNVNRTIQHQIFEQGTVGLSYLF